MKLLSERLRQIPNILFGTTVTLHISHFQIVVFKQMLRSFRTDCQSRDVHLRKEEAVLREEFVARFSSRERERGIKQGYAALSIIYVCFCGPCVTQIM